MLLFVAAVLAAPSCRQGETGDPDGGPVEGDAGDADASGDADRDAGDAEPPPVCEAHSGIAPGQEISGAGDELVEYRAYMGSEMPYDVLRVQIFGDNVTGVEPGVYDLAGTSWDDCEVCVSILTGCYTGPCERLFYPRVGAIEILAIGGEGDRFAARLSGISMEEYEIVDGMIAEDPLPDGEDWCVEEHEFDLVTMSTFDAICARPTVPCLEETVFDFELESCTTGEMVSMTSLAEGQRALVYSMVAGWCPYCSDWMAVIKGYQEAYESAGLEVAYVFGEDSMQWSPDAAECLEYADWHSADPEKFYLDHDGEYAFAVTTWAMWPWAAEADEMALPWSTIIDAQTFQYVYTSHADPPLDFETVLLGLLEAEP